MSVSAGRSSCVTLLGAAVLSTTGLRALGYSCIVRKCDTAYPYGHGQQDTLLLGTLVVAYHQDEPTWQEALSWCTGDRDELLAVVVALCAPLSSSGGSQHERSMEESPNAALEYDLRRRLTAHRRSLVHKKGRNRPRWLGKGPEDVKVMIEPSSLDVCSG